MFPVGITASKRAKRRINGSYHRTGFIICTIYEGSKKHETGQRTSLCITFEAIMVLALNSQSSFHKSNRIPNQLDFSWERATVLQMTKPTDKNPPGLEGVMFTKCGQDYL
jgi:hypothetical protein